MTYAPRRPQQLSESAVLASFTVQPPGLPGSAVQAQSSHAHGPQAGGPRSPRLPQACPLRKLDGPRLNGQAAPEPQTQEPVSVPSPSSATRSQAPTGELPGFPGSLLWSWELSPV